MKERKRQRRPKMQEEKGKERRACMHLLTTQGHQRVEIYHLRASSVFHSRLKIKNATQGAARVLLSALTKPNKLLAPNGKGLGRQNQESQTDCSQRCERASKASQRRERTITQRFPGKNNCAMATSCSFACACST